MKLSYLIPNYIFEVETIKPNAISRGYGKTTWKWDTQNGPWEFEIEKFDKDSEYKLWKADTNWNMDIGGNVPKEIFNVANTIVKCIKDEINRDGNPDTITIVLPNRIVRIANRFLKREFPKSNIKVQGCCTLSVEFNNK
jgi:hypothetical protein